MARTHWLPRPLNENVRRTACGIDVYEHDHVEWRTSQNEVDCRRCLTVDVPEGDDADWAGLRVGERGSPALAWLTPRETWLGQRGEAGSLRTREDDA